MGATRHLTVKQGVMLGLILLLAISLKVAGSVGRADPHAALTPSIPLAEAPTRPQSLTETMAEHLKRIEAPLPPLDAAPAFQPSAEPLYAASGQRDPLQSLLPPEPGPMFTTTADGTAMPMDQAPQPPPTVVLQGVFWGGGVPTAIINGQVYRIGDTVSGATIRAIDRRGIELEFQGVTYLTTMKGTTTMRSQELPWR